VYGRSVLEECTGGVYGRSVWEECVGGVCGRSVFCTSSDESCSSAISALASASCLSMRSCPSLPNKQHTKITTLRRRGREEGMGGIWGGGEGGYANGCTITYA
jgi:hypothetical protein